MSNSWLTNRITEHLLKDQQEIHYNLYSGAQPNSMQSGQQKGSYGFWFIRPLCVMCMAIRWRRKSREREGDLRV